MRQHQKPIDEKDEDDDSQDEVHFSLKGEPSKLQSEKEKCAFTETRTQDSLSHTPANVMIHHRQINEQDSSSSNQSDDEEEIIVVVVDHHQEEESRPIPTDEHDETGLSYMDVNQADKNKWTALHWSSFKGEYSKCFDLISRGADVNLPDEHGFSPLFVAARRGHLDIVQLLLESGADVHRRNYEGKTAINMAKEKKFFQVKVL